MLAFGAVFALGLWAGRLRFTCPHRFEFRVDHCSWAGLLDYINDYGFIGGFGRPSRQLGRLRSGFFGARSACICGALDCSVREDAQPVRCLWPMRCRVRGARADSSLPDQRTSRLPEASQKASPKRMLRVLSCVRTSQALEIQVHRVGMQ
jgi:hypothetical protein